MKSRVCVVLLLLAGSAAAQLGSPEPASAFVSATDLGIPAKARKEFNKANELARKQEWAETIQRLDKAIAIYPAYASAYNNLGVTYSHLGDLERSRDALEKAISLNDRLAPAYINLARNNIRTGDFADAETALTKALALSPSDPMTLALRAYSEFMERRFDEAIVDSRKAHALHGPHSVAHQVAARAFEEQRQTADAIAQLELFLKEEPSGHRAEAARKELENLRATPSPTRRLMVLSLEPEP